MVESEDGICGRVDFDDGGGDDDELLAEAVGDVDWEESLDNEGPWTDCDDRGKLTNVATSGDSSVTDDSDCEEAGVPSSL